MHVRWTMLLAVLVLWAASIGAEGGSTFVIPGSLLVFGNYNELRVVTSDGAQLLKPPIDEGYNRGYFANPTIASRAGLIAWSFATGWRDEHPRYKARFALGVYSLSDQKWRAYGDFDNIGDAGISSDGAKVAFIARQQDRLTLVILDVAAERMTEGPYLAGMWPRGTPSWSPDMSRLAVQIRRSDESSFVGVLNLRTGAVQPLDDGFHPQWSPDGEWIAYYLGAKCLLIHPDGTGLKTAIELRDSWFKFRNFGWGGPVWSPDSKHLLMNVTKNGGPLLDVVLLDLTTGRTTTKSKSGLPVFGSTRYPVGS